MHLTSVQLRILKSIANWDYEVRGLLKAYEAGTIDQGGFTLLLEAIDG